jgi:hypothetical protein
LSKSAILKSVKWSKSKSAKFGRDRQGLEAPQLQSVEGTAAPVQQMAKHHRLNITQCHVVELDFSNPRLKD